VGAPWFSHRQAYAPATLPIVVMVLAVSLPVAWFTFPLPWAPWSNILLGWVIGGGVVRLRWWLWRRQHPVISAEEWARARTRAAPFN
jgi:hypothetical protein